MTRTARILCLLHLPANALLLWLAYEWLSMAESTLARLAASAAAALLLLALACWLHGATFAGFRRGAGPGVAAAFRTALRNLLPLLLVALAAMALYGFLAWWADYSATPSARLASWLTFHLRRPVKPAMVLRCFNAVLWMVRWALLPAELLPLASGVAARGWRGLGEFGWRRDSRLYRLEVPLLALCALWLPFRLLHWAPRVSGFNMEMLSFALRAGAAYLLFVGAVLLVEFLTSRGKPAASQLRTVASP
jgi:hypothetical protein